jgi:hypothetical protein
MANQPKLMRRLLLEMLVEESWIEFVGEATQEAEIRELAQKTAPDLVVVTADRPGRRPAICDEPLSEFLALRLIGSHRLTIMPFAIGRHSTSMPTKSNHRSTDFLAQ